MGQVRRAEVSFCTAFLLSTGLFAGAQIPTETGLSPCSADLERVGIMDDILSNALTLGWHRDPAVVQKVLGDCRVGCRSGADLLKKTAQVLGVSEAALRAEVEKFRHVNCNHGPVAGPNATKGDPSGPPEDPKPQSEPSHVSVLMTDFAERVTLHVVLHELGHALIREFDLLVLGNEETMADAFATHFLTTHLKDRALPVLQARIASLLFEAQSVPKDQWTFAGEHNHDARRAYQIAALALAADPQHFAPLGQMVAMNDDQVRESTDYGADIHRAWRRVLAPLWMPAGSLSTEVRMRFEPDGPIVAQLRGSSLAADLEAAARRFDWHSQVTIQFAEGDGGAGWNRSRRTIRVNTGYVRRFVEQGTAIDRPK